MRFNVKSILHMPGGTLPFAFSLDMGGLEFYSQRPFAQLVEISGTVKNRADVLWLDGEGKTTLSMRCDRCGKAFEMPFRVPVHFMLATELEDEEQDDILLLEEDAIDLAELFQTELIIQAPTKSLCQEACKGLCDGCGANLNEERCACKREIDPRLADLAKFFD